MRARTRSHDRITRLEARDVAALDVRTRVDTASRAAAVHASRRAAPIGFVFQAIAVAITVTMLAFALSRPSSPSLSNVSAVGAR